MRGPLRLWRALDFGGLVSDEAIFHPSDGQEIDEGAPGAVSQAVLCGAGVAGGMLDGFLSDSEAAHLHERGHEAMHPLVELKPVEAVTAVQLEAARRVANVFLADPVAHAVGDAGLHASQPGVFALLAPAGDHVV